MLLSLVSTLAAAVSSTGLLAPTTISDPSLALSGHDGYASLIDTENTLEMGFYAQTQDFTGADRDIEVESGVSTLLSKVGRTQLADVDFAPGGALIKLSKETVQVNVIHAAVGQISESDVLLAAASNAIIVGFQVRPSAAARKLAEKEEIEIRLYSIIYDAINDIKDAIEGMLEPVMKEEIVCSIEVMEIFKISKVGTVAGCIVREGKLQRNTPIRVIRDGIVIHTGRLGSLKRFKDDVKEVVSGQDCGLNIESYNDIRVGDIVEGYEQVEVKRK